MFKKLLCLKPRSHLSVAEWSKASFLVHFIVCSVKHINALCSFATLQLGVTTGSCIVIFASLNSDTLKRERALTKKKNKLLYPSKLKMFFLKR